MGINSTDKAHLGRQQTGAREVEMAGLYHDHTRRVGTWDSESIEDSFLTGLPRAAIIVVQGFPEEKGSFWLSRALVTPPLSLQQREFP